MAFVRTKRVDGNEYHQLVESYRENGRMRQRVLAHLGKASTLEEAIQDTTKELEKLRAEQQALLDERKGILEELQKELPEVMAYHKGVPPRWRKLERAEAYKLMSGQSRWGRLRLFYRSSYTRRDYFGDQVPYEGYYGFMGICGRYWKIPKRIEKLEEKAKRIETRLAKLKALV